MMIFKAQKSFSLLTFHLLFTFLFLLFLLTFQSTNFLHSHFHFHHNQATETPHTCMSEKRLCGYFISCGLNFHFFFVLYAAWWCWINLAIIKFSFYFPHFHCFSNFHMIASCNEEIIWQLLMHLSIHDDEWWEISMMSLVLYVFLWIEYIRNYFHEFYSFLIKYFRDIYDDEYEDVKSLRIEILKFKY